jgi:hypothetical protein
MKTEELAAINEAVKKKLNVKWDVIELEQAPHVELEKGIHQRKMFPIPGAPMRLWHDGLLVGSITWCCIKCEVISSRPMKKIGGYDNAVQLVTFKTPNELGSHGVNPYFCAVISPIEYFPCYNWNPIPMKSPDEAGRYLTGWTL